MVLYLKDPKESTKSLFDLTNTFSNVAEFKSNIKKSIALLYTNNKFNEKETRNTIPITIALLPQ
jgi:hypothetical protein